MTRPLICFLLAFFQYFASNAQINPALLAAVQSNDLKALMALHDRTVLNARDAHQATLLYLAAYKGNLEMVKKYKVQTLTDLSGTEEALYELCQGRKSPSILHFSTHGFFFSDPIKDSLSAQRVVPFALSNSSMLRSCIMFSGCYRFWTTGKTYPGLHDGILTAYEAAQLDLTNTELVVLSACERTLGDLNTEGGVFGLQRTFIQAGAHYVIMSLWKVDDFATKEFIVTFYTKWLQSKMSIPDAFRETQLYMRKSIIIPISGRGLSLLNRYDTLILNQSKFP